MISEEHSIEGGDFAGAGAASNRLKERLKRIGVHPQILRKTMIAAYEAELNVVIHAYRGTMRYTIDGERLSIQVSDEGPGIEDPELALEEGYSTASVVAREMGFGAGLGLPNIRKSADSFTIDTRIGVGTVLDIRIALQGQETEEEHRHFLRTTAGSCGGSLHCVSACPTQAIRVHGGAPRILHHLCIDCTACLAACPNGVFGIEGPSVRLPEARILVIPAAVLFRTIPSVDPGVIARTIGELGYRQIRLLEGWEDALLRHSWKRAERKSAQRPVIPPVCPAVVNLITLKYPSLIDHIAPFLSPIEAAFHELRGEPAAFAPGCPAQRSALAGVTSWEPPVVVPLRALRRAVVSRLQGNGSAALRLIDPPARVRDTGSGSGVRIGGIHAVVSVLEQLEREAMEDVPLLELYACPEGCFGTPLLSGNPAVSRYRWEQERSGRLRSEAAVWRSRPYRPRTGARLHADLSRAVSLLAEIESVAAGLPGSNCGACGSPSCLALAEDIVAGRAAREDCVFGKPNRNPGERSVV